MKNRRHTEPQKRHDGNAFSITFIGHATILIQIGGLNIITDPFFSDRPVSDFTAALQNNEVDPKQFHVLECAQSKNFNHSK